MVYTDSIAPGHFTLCKCSVTSSKSHKNGCLSGIMHEVTTLVCNNYVHVYSDATATRGDLSNMLSDTSPIQGC